jgi:Integrase zinc binding domain
MEIVDNTRTFGKVDGKFEFYRNTYILKKGDVFFYAFTYVRRQLIRNVKIDELDVHPIPVDAICPPFSQDLTLAPDPLPQDCYVKGPRYIQYEPEAPVGCRPCDRLMKEIQICEILKENPHPNIAQYMCFTVRNNRINGLVFTKYHTTLADRFKDKHRPLRPAVYLEGIENGHGLGLIHNDINPSADVSYSGGTCVKSELLARVYLHQAEYTGEDLLIGQYLKTLRRPDSLMDMEYQQLRRNSKSFFIRDGYLYKRGRKRGMPPRRVVGLPEQPVEIVRECQGEISHRGKGATFEHVKRRYQWKGMYEDVEKWVKTCEDCQRRAKIRYEEPLHPTWTLKVVDKIGVDVVYMPQTQEGSFIVFCKR